MQLLTKITIKSLLSTLLIFVSGHAMASDNDTGIYHGLEGGLTIYEAVNIFGHKLVHNHPANPNDHAGEEKKVTINHGIGWNGLYKIGYRYNGWRLETQLGYAESDVEKHRQTIGEAVLNIPERGKTTTYSAMLAAKYYLTLSPITTKAGIYVGAGAGVAHIQGKGIDKKKVDVTEVIIRDHSDTAFAWQLETGGFYNISPRVDISLGYRFFKTPNVDVIDSSYHYTEKPTYKTHNVNLGFTYKFR